MDSFFRESITLKFVMVTILVLLLLIPVDMVKTLIHERESRRNEVMREIHSSWANDQQLTGPFIISQFQSAQIVNGQNSTVTKTTHILPESLVIKGRLVPEIRYRGIYKVVVYRTELTISGTFSGQNMERPGPETLHPAVSKPRIALGISDMRGINREVSFTLNGAQKKAEPGIPANAVASSGISTELPEYEGDLSFTVNLDLNGSSKLGFVPLGEKTIASLASTWASPSFSGAFLPDRRTVSKDGFEAEWDILELNRNYPQQWVDDAFTVGESSFGVDLLVPVDLYQKSYRSVKYAIMFVSLTFLVLLFSELLLKGRRMHIIQYLLVGMALCIFYTLLISLAEQIGFTPAYLTASLATILLITIYSASVLKNKKSTFFTGLILVFLYLFLYVILQLEDYALLMGSIGLFAVLVVIMYLSRKVDWTVNPDREA